MEKKNNSMLACRMVCCSHRSDRRIWVCTSHLSDCRIRVCISHRSDYASIIGHPLGGGDPGQIQRWMGTYTGIWTINLPWRRGKWGRFVFQKPCTAGKTGDFANETGQFQVVLNEETWRPLCRRTWSTFLLVFVMATSADGAGIVM